MKTLNRAYLTVNPTEKFWNLVGPSIEDKDFIAFHEPTLYLIEEEIWDEEIIITKYMKKITKNEISQVTDQDISSIPIEKSEDFLSYFTIELGGTVIDCISAPIERL
jgi:hypothetical protein